MNSKRHWFFKEVFYWRTFASFVWSFMLFPPAMSVYLFLLQASLFYPHHWLADWLYLLFSRTSFLFGFLIAFSSFFVAFSRTLFYTVIPTVHGNRLSLLLAMTKPPLVLHVIFHMFTGAFTMYYLSGLMGNQYDNLVVPCADELFCLNEYHLFLVVYGLFLGLIYGASYHLYGENVLPFPAIQPLKFFQVKSHVLPSVMSAFRKTFWLTVYFYIYYFFAGCIWRSQIVSALNLHGSMVHLDSVLGMLDLYYFWKVWLSSTFIYHLWDFSGYLFKIFNTEVFHFPLEAALAIDQDACLEKVLAHESSLLVRYHAYQDLCDLAENSAMRRKQIFTLSQPGGHPHNWLAISSQCLSLIDSLTVKLRENIPNGLEKSYGTTSRIPLVPQASLVYSSTLNDNTTIYRTPRGASSESRSLSSGQRDSVFSLSYSADASQLHGGYVPKGRQPIHSDAYLTQSPSKQVKMYVRGGRLARLREKIIPKKLLEVWPEASSRSLFVNCQLHIWALEALSSLVAFSFHEDMFGVVQTTLPDILASLLALNNIIEKHQKLSQLNWETTSPSHDSLVLQSSVMVMKLRRDLRATVKTSLHRIVAVFGNHLTGISLSPEYRKQLQQLMDYRE